MTNNPLAAASPNGRSLEPGRCPAGAEPRWRYQHAAEQQRHHDANYSDFDVEIELPLLQLRQQTPRIIEPCWIAYDGTGTAPASARHPCGPAGFEGSISSLSISYIKQNAGEELNWRPTKEWNFNAAGGWEGYNYTEADAGYTNEYSVKGSVDWKPFGWLTARASGYYSDRIAGNYSYLNNVAAIQYPIFPTRHATVCYPYPELRRLCLFLGLSAIHVRQSAADKGGLLARCRGVSRRDHHPHLQIQGRLLSTQYRHWRSSRGLAEGLSDQKMISGGVDVAWVITPTLSIVASYYYEYYHQNRCIATPSIRHGSWHRRRRRLSLWSPPSTTSS